MHQIKKALIHLLLCLLGALLLLQLFFLSQVFLMRYVDPESTSFQRSELIRLGLSQHPLRWSQRWVTGSKISTQLKRAVIVSEDDLFANHDGVQWGAIERAWKKNQSSPGHNTSIGLLQSTPSKSKVVGGSTITQQLAKNLFLSGERTFLRKGQEFLITLYLEAQIGRAHV